MDDMNKTASEVAAAADYAPTSQERYYQAHDRRQRAVNAAIALSQLQRKPVEVDDFLVNVAKIDTYLETGKTENAE